MNLIDQQNSLVIDVTYNCNAKCHYCKWGNTETPGRVNLPDESVYISEEILKNLNTQRIVFSGGEPLLRHDLEHIISYYKKLDVQSIILITNGFLLSEKRLTSLVAAGLTNISFSIDSFDPEVAFATRAYNNLQVAKLVSNFTKTCALKNEFGLELGINVVVSSANIRENHMADFVDFANEFPIDCIKFQPIFNDGYSGKNAPNLLLSTFHAHKLRAIGHDIPTRSKAYTNPTRFWESIAEVLEGKKLVGKSCGLDTRQAIVQKDKIKICSWINYPTYDINKRPISKTQEKFAKVKARCKTGTYCYCLQNVAHSWETA